MLSFDLPPVVFPRGAECKRLFSQSAGRAAAAFRAKKVGSGGAWFIEPEDRRSEQGEREREREKIAERRGGTYSRRREVIIRLSSRISRRDPADNAGKPKGLPTCARIRLSSLTCKKMYNKIKLSEYRSSRSKNISDEIEKP